MIGNELDFFLFFFLGKSFHSLCNPPLCTVAVFASDFHLLPLICRLVSNPQFPNAVTSIGLVEDSCGPGQASPAQLRQIKLKEVNCSGDVWSEGTQLHVFTQTRELVYCLKKYVHRCHVSAYRHTDTIQSYDDGFYTRHVVLGLDSLWELLD